MVGLVVLKNRIVRNILALCFGLGCSALLLVTVEFALRLSQPPSPQWREQGSNHLFEDDPIMGYRLRANLDRKVSYYKGSDLLGTYHYRSNQFGWRIWEKPPRLGPRRERFAIFFGCSYAFGQELDDQDTLPFLYEELQSEQRAYNLAVPGYGLQHLWGLFHQDKWVQGIEQSNGDFFYVLWTGTGGHIRRVLGAKRIHWAEHLPKLGRDANGDLQVEGIFADVAPWRMRLFKWMRSLQIFRSVEIPLALTNEHYQLAAEILEQSARKLRQVFPGSRFYLVVHPWTDGEEWHKLESFLGERSYEVLDFSLIEVEGKGASAVGGHHPGPLVNQILAQKINALVNKPQTESQLSITGQERNPWVSAAFHRH